MLFRGVSFRPATLAVLLIAFLISAASNGTHASPTESEIFAVNRDPAVQIVHFDRLKITEGTRLCVTTSADPATLRIIAASGERLEANLDGLSMQSAIALSQKLQERGLLPRLNDAVRTRRVTALVQNNRQLDCMSSGNAILLRQEILPASSGRGYRALITASQGQQKFIAQIVRDKLIPVSDEERLSRPDDATTKRDGSPFWDARHDIIKLRNAFFENAYLGR